MTVANAVYAAIQAFLTAIVKTSPRLWQKVQVGASATIVYVRPSRRTAQPACAGGISPIVLRISIGQNTAWLDAVNRSNRPSNASISQRLDVVVQ
jgi:hypothetical protein